MKLLDKSKAAPTEIGNGFTNCLHLQRKQSNYNTAANCPRFNKCSAPICPIDPKWVDRRHLEGERVCYYLRNHSKGIDIANLKGVYTGFERLVIANYPKIKERFYPLKKQLNRLERAANDGGDDV